jgi:serine/threonine-protein kinase
MDFYCNNLGTTLGESYETEKPSRVLTVDKAIRYTRQILEGLACLHWAGIVHRDIKPFNILITDHDTVKICDFGLSKLRGETFRGHRSLKIGSPYYASPEQEADPDAAGPPADLYSVGVTLFRMLAGRLPLDPGKALSSFNADLDGHWDGFIRRAMATDPGDRFASADGMLQELEALETDWRRKKENLCAAPLSLFQDAPASFNPEPRSESAKVPRAMAVEAFGLDDLMRPRVHARNDFETLSRDTVLDRSTGLVWQWSGTRFPVNRQGALDYVASLNRERAGGLDGWRLPTIPELMTLLCPAPSGVDLCMEPVFDRTQKWLWSSDRCTFTAAWYVSLDLGFVAFNDFSSFYHVKAVTGGTRSTGA